ncbi:hypothetical protein DI396_02905 [Litorivita pollutaquae]|uniref:Uncharacterized protein n=1 Tax=Litorivita pollutaquae TaxID=2200892 RepID=A0A2V4NR66_9RHOB|nr:hypothetical protein [Litorivita pollutaquae]OUS20546.1 hypothetical protein A9Q95_09390 [Rhodobacterales bacterium 59_46_T64]PYC49027.1 hypothetical protein DI396_02905 [Litorivita pollutaquae]
MTTYLTDEMRQGVQRARKLAAASKTRLHVEADGQTHRVLRRWDNGFALDADTAPHLRGNVDLYDGPRHIYQCLIIASEQEGGEMRFEYKRATAARQTAPVDFERDRDAPSGLISGPV